jgi:hypothetical protein
MGIDVELQDEMGKSVQRIGDPQSLLARALPDARDETFVCLRFIDPYGDTTFNRHQCALVADELRRVAHGASGEARAHLGKVERLARQAVEDVHLYLKFIGD